MSPEQKEVRSAVARTLAGYRVETPEQGFARRSRGGKATRAAQKDPEARVLRAYAQYVRAWKIAVRARERNPSIKPVNVPDPTGIDINALLKQQAKQPK